MLNDILKHIAEANPTCAELKMIAEKLGQSELHYLAIVHVSALLELLPAIESQETLVFGGISVSIFDNRDRSDVYYEDVDTGYAIEGVTLARHDGPNTAVGMLDLIDYARTRTDTLVYLPQDMRRNRIIELADRVSASERFVRYILQNMSAIERQLIQ